MSRESNLESIRCTDTRLHNRAKTVGGIDAIWGGCLFESSLTLLKSAISCLESAMSLNMFSRRLVNACPHSANRTETTNSPRDAWNSRCGTEDG